MIYLDNASTSFPKPPELYAAMEPAMRELAANPGRGAFRMALATQERLDDARRLLCDFFGGADPLRLIFTLNTTDALNIAIKGVLSEKGGHAVTSCLEHNSVRRCLNRLEAEGAIEVTWVRPEPDGILDPEAVAAALRDDTRLVALTHCSNVLGTIQPVAEIGSLIADHPALYLVDAAQSAGILPINVEAMHIDLLAFAGHKALLGPTGTGGLYVREGVAVDHWREGGSGFDSISATHPEDMPFRLESGTPNMLGICLLREGVGYVKRRGVEAILQHERELVGRLIDALRGDERFTLYGALEPERRTGVLSLNIHGVTSQQVADTLDADYDIGIRPRLQCAPGAHEFIGTYPEGTVRVSPGCFNTAEDIDAILHALREIADRSAG